MTNIPPGQTPSSGQEQQSTALGRWVLCVQEPQLATTWWQAVPAPRLIPADGGWLAEREPPQPGCGWVVHPATPTIMPVITLTQLPAPQCALQKTPKSYHRSPAASQGFLISLLMGKEGAVFLCPRRKKYSIKTHPTFPTSSVGDMWSKQQLSLGDLETEQ